MYSAALVVYPALLRTQYGDEMRRTFEAGCRHAEARGTLPLLALLGRELADLAAASIAARRRQGPATAGRHVRKSRHLHHTWVRLSRTFIVSHAHEPSALSHVSEGVIQ